MEFVGVEPLLVDEGFPLVVEDWLPPLDVLDGGFVDEESSELVVLEGGWLEDDEDVLVEDSAELELDGVVISIDVKDTFALWLSTPLG